MYQQTRDSSKVLAVVGGLDLVKHDKMKEAIARFSRSKGPKFVGVRYLLVWDEEDYLTREDVHQGEETFVTFQLIIYYLTRKKAAYQPLFPRPCGQLVGLCPTCFILYLWHGSLGVTKVFGA